MSSSAAGTQCASPAKQADGASFNSDQSSSLSECSQVLHYFNCSDGFSVSASLLPSFGFGDGNKALASSSNFSATSSSSLTTGGNSLLSGSSALQQSINMKAESLLSTAAGSVGLPTSPLSFSSSNVSLPGSSGLSMTSLSHPGTMPVNRLEAAGDPTFHPSKLIRVDNEYLSMLNSEDPSRLGWHPNLANFRRSQQGFGTNTASRFDHGYNGQGGLAAVQQDFHSNEQQLAQLHSSIPTGRQESFLQQPIAQNSFQSRSPLLSAQFHRNDILHLQSAHGNPLQQQLIQQGQVIQMMPPQLQRPHLLHQQQHLQQHQQLRHQQQQHQFQHQMAGLSKQQDKILSGLCSRRLMQYIRHQRARPADNNIGFWREFTTEYFAPSSRKRWCLSRCSTSGRNQPSGIFPQELWCCEICGARPGRGFEVAVDVMPRLCKSKFDNGELDELLFVDLPHEYRLNTGHIVLEYNKAVQESVYDQLRVVWEGQLKIIFTSDLKIASWDFCAKSHEELLPQRSIVPQVNHLVALALKYQSMANSGGNGLSIHELQAICKVFVACAHQLANNLEPPCVNELGFTKRFVRCIQIAEVVNSMKELIDFSVENKSGPIESLARLRTWRAPVAVPESMGRNQPDTEEITSYSGGHLKIEDHGNVLGEPVSEHSNLVQLRFAQPGGGSQQNLLYGNSSVARTSSGASGLAHASPTSSLTSYQNCFSSLTDNTQSSVTSFQKPAVEASASVNILQQPSFQQKLQPIDSMSGVPVQQSFQGTSNSQQSRPGPASAYKNLEAQG